MFRWPYKQCYALLYLNVASSIFDWIMLKRLFLGEPGAPRGCARATDLHLLSRWSLVWKTLKQLYSGEPGAPRGCSWATELHLWLDNVWCGMYLKRLFLGEPGAPRGSARATELHLLSRWSLVWEMFETAVFRWAWCSTWPCPSYGAPPLAGWSLPTCSACSGPTLSSSSSTSGAWILWHVTRPLADFLVSFPLTSF